MTTKRSLSVCLIVMLGLCLASTPLATHAATSLLGHPTLTPLSNVPTPPTNLTVANDDLVSEADWTAPNDTTVVGYKVTWWDNANPNATSTAWTPYTRVDLQPLVAAHTYSAEVQSVDGNGTLSSILGPNSGVQSDPTRVNGLATSMNGLFASFDSNSIDPLQFYASYNNAASMSGIFPMSNQAHMHEFTQSTTLGGDSTRATSTLRALRPFDFTNRTGTVVFDLDMAKLAKLYPTHDSDINSTDWYVTLSPTESDDTPYGVFQNNTAYSIYPLDVYQVKIGQCTAFLRRFVNGSTAAPGHILQTNLPASDCDANVRNHAKLTISSSLVQLYVNNTLILQDTAPSLDFSTAWVQFQQFNYRLRLSHYPYTLSHWDNLGFDAPAGGYAPPVVHSYTDGTLVNSDQHVSPASFNVNIPDTLAGATSANLLVDTNTTNTTATATVTVNGQAITWQALGLNDTPAYHDARVMSIPLGDLVVGTNTVSLTDNCSGCMNFQNAHIEVMFPNGSTAPYTPPSPSQFGEMSPMSLAPFPNFGTGVPANGSTVSGTVNFEVTGNGAYSLTATGHVDPVTQVEVLVDGTVAGTYTLPAQTVATDQIIPVNTASFANGTHTITVTAVGAEGVSLNSDDPLLTSNGGPTTSNQISLTFSN